MKILNSPAYLDGESWPGYLLRLAEANGFSGLGAIARILHQTNYQVIASSPPATLRLLSVNCDTLMGIDYAVAPQGCNYVELGTYGRSVYARVCSKCLTVDAIPYARSIWDMALQVCCAVHSCMLIDECPQCTHRLDYQRPSILRCACGFDLRLCRTQPASSLYSTIRETLEIDDPCPPHLTTFAPSSRRECNALALLLRLLAQAHPCPKPGRHTAKIGSHQAFIRARDLDAVAGWFENWPNGFIHRLICAKRARTQSRAVKLNSSSLMTGQFSKIRQAVMDADARWRRSPRPGKQTLDRNSLLQKDLLGVRDLMTLTGRHHNDVIVWLRTGLLGNTVVQQDHMGRDVLKVPTSQVLRLLSLVQQTTTFRDAAQTIGVDPLVLRTLARQGRMPSLKMGKADFTARVRPEDVYAFAKQVRSVAHQSRANGQRPVDFSCAVRLVLRRRKRHFGKFLDELGSQGLPLRVFEKHAVYLNDTYIYHDDLMTWMARNA